MIDFIKTQISGPSVEELLNHPLLDFNAKVSVTTGDVNTDTQTAEFRSLKFVIKGSRYINLQGSLHKFYTGGINYNGFAIFEIREALHELSSTFNIDLRKSILHNLEYGVNIKLRNSPQVLIESLLNYKGDIFQPMYGKARRTGRECIKQQYKVKFYNKGWQCERPEYILRIENKVVKMKYLESFNISTLSDIADQEKLKLLMDDLVKTFSEILMRDPKINLNDCNASERKLLKYGKYAGYWQDLKKEDRKRHDYYRRRFRGLTEKYGQNTQKHIRELIKKKADHLLSLNHNSLANLTNKEIQIGVSNYEKSLAKLTKLQIQEFNDNNHSSSMVITSNNMADLLFNKCARCGKEIVGRRSTAKYCREPCRITNKNRRRDIRLPLKRFVEKQKEMPTLFDANQYLVLSKEQRMIAEHYEIEFE